MVEYNLMERVNEQQTKMKRGKVPGFMCWHADNEEIRCMKLR